MSGYGVTLRVTLMSPAAPSLADTCDLCRQVWPPAGGRGRHGLMTGFLFMAAGEEGPATAASHLHR